ncbi:hypothetical protein niasHT_009635 [Heterodera trifolii]|uniref:Myotubularin phosphatase domain-containing protein n=1 Tax=Heterodera trifolii TaxID=157864 RepID=A0ABD2LWV9_9BILA
MELSEAIERCRVDDVFLCEGPRPPQKGSLALIGHHLIFSPAAAAAVPSSSSASSPASLASPGGVPAAVKSGDNANDTATTAAGSDQHEFWLLHRAIDRVIVEPISREPNPLRQQGAFLRLKCKNFMHLCFEMNDLSDCQAVARSIEKLSNLHGVAHDYPFYYRCPFVVLDNGWEAYSVEQLLFARLQLHARDKWRISSVNRGFEVCASYSEFVVVPKGIGDDYLRISGTFRDGGRFPVLSYYHRPTRSCIVRCAQPLIGPTNRRCKEDEVILNAFLSKFSKGMIFDTRTKLVAQTSRGKGGGCESQMYYSQWKYVYGNVSRIGTLRESLARLIDACIENHPDKWLSRLANSGWLQYVVDALTAAATVAQVVHCMDEEVPVLIHGGEGTDATLLVSALAQLMLDPDARTVRGFQSLIEHEWLMAGHPFSLRCAHSAFATGAQTGPYEAPVFLCFLDCVWQLMRQYPTCMEFNERFLIFLFEHAYASEFGSFLGNNELEKKRLGVKDRTVSLWSYVNHPAALTDFISTLYEPYALPLWPSVAPQSIVLWERMYFRWQRIWTDADRCQQMVDDCRQAEKELMMARHAMLAQKGCHRPQAVTAPAAAAAEEHRSAAPIHGEEHPLSISVCSSTITSSSVPSSASVSVPSSSAAAVAASVDFHHHNHQQHDDDGDQHNSGSKVFRFDHHQHNNRQQHIKAPPFALEEVVKLDRLNIRSPSSEECNDGDNGHNDGQMCHHQPHHRPGGTIGWTAKQWRHQQQQNGASGTDERNNNSSATSAMLDGAKQWLQRWGGGGGTPFL